MVAKARIELATLGYEPKLGATPPRHIRDCARLVLPQHLDRYERPALLLSYEHIVLKHYRKKLERPDGIEPSSEDWQTSALPLDDGRIGGAYRCRSDQVFRARENCTLVHAP